MHIKAIAEKPTGRLIGAQIVGGRGAGKRIDVVATAMWVGLPAHELAWTDLAYSPPFSGVWDPVHIAARKAGEKAIRSS
jgi:pyruvate/2-oxoglutarate dehydrogenase complex dihydrolipoamide dehydrogenase (E3) component